MPSEPHLSPPFRRVVWGGREGKGQKVKPSSPSHGAPALPPLAPLNLSLSPPFPRLWPFLSPPSQWSDSSVPWALISGNAVTSCPLPAREEEGYPCQVGLLVS